MFSNTEIGAGFGRLTANKLRPRDRKTLFSYFRLYLKNRASAFPDLADRLAQATDASGDETASTLAALVIYLEENGGALAELKGGRSGLETDEAGEMLLKIRFGLMQLDYELPEEFSGSLESGNGGGGGFSGVVFFPSTTVKKDYGW